MPSVLRVMSWNVHMLADDRDEVLDVLRTSGADVVCLQETHRYPGSRVRLASLARRSGLYFSAGGRVAAGIAVLTSLRTQVHDAHAVGLPVGLWRRGRPVRPRGYAGAVVSLPGSSPVTVLDVHLSTDAADRRRHTAHLRRVIDASPYPVVVAGDLNEEPGAPSWKELLDAGLADPGEGGAPTFPARDPHRRIDVVLADRSLAVDTYQVLSTPSSTSDHLPVVAGVVLPG